MNVDNSVLHAPIDTPDMLDSLWSHFNSTGDVAAVRRIVSVLDGVDGVRANLQDWLNTVPPDAWDESPHREHLNTLLRCQFPVSAEHRFVAEPLDLDIHVAVLARAGELKFSELPFQLYQDELLHPAMKSAALWSLLSMSEQHPAVAAACDEESRIPGGAARLHLSTPA